MTEIDWKCNVINNLIARDKTERDPFSEIYRKYDTLVLKIASIKDTGSPKNNTELSMENDALGNLKAETDENILKLNEQLQSYYIQTAKHETRISILLENIDNLKSDSFELKNELESIKKQKETIEEENRILNSTILKLEQKLSTIETENAELLSKYVKLIEDSADAMNKSNEKIWQSKKMKESTSLTTIRIETTEFNDRVISEVPKIDIKNFDLPEDLYCMSFDNSGTQLAASSGNCVYLFSTDQDLRLRGRLSGPVNFVNSVDFSKNDNLLVASSSDKACYIWNLNSKQLVDSLTGHGDKVTTAKFCVNSGASLVSASRDRSIILWDIQSKISINKLFVNSSCIDFISLSSLTGISAHADKNIRMIDFRSSKIELEQSLPDKITSICSTIDRNILAVSCRDDCIYLCDPRFDKDPIQINDKDLKFPCDWSRIGLAPDGVYVSAGSKESNILVWNVKKKCPEALLNGGHKHPVVSCAWNTTGKGLATCDTRKHLVMWK